MMKELLPFLLTILSFQLSGQLNMQLLDQLDYNVNVNDVWGWVDQTSGKEYAIVGLNTGVSIVDVSIPTNIVEVEFITGPNSTWRDIKSWGHHVYVTNETGGGLLVIDMSGAPSNITWTNWMPNLSPYGNLSDCHNLYIDEFGYCYLSGCNLNSGGILIVDVFSSPGIPNFVAVGPSVYAHDVFTQENIMYTSEIYGGDLGVYDVNNKFNITQLASQPTPYNFTHNAWVNAENTVVFTTDEKANAPVTAYDISDFDDIIELDQFRPLSTLNQNVIPHNVHVWDNWLIISYYTSGGIIADASRPENIIEVGNWDTFLGGNGGFNGAWGAYPFLPSGLVLLSDRSNGLIVCGANYVRACWLEGKITNADSGGPVFGAEIDIASSQANYTTSDLIGNYKTGQAISGTFDVTFSATGYISKTVSAILENGVLTILDVALEPLVPVDEFSGKVISAVDGTPVAAAQVILESNTFSFSTFTDQNGQFTFTNIFRDEYTIAAARWGFHHVAATNLLIDQDSDSLTLQTFPGYQDDFFTSQGWTTQTTASEGWWDREAPVGTLLNGEPSNPGSDLSGDIGSQCFVTGNNGGNADQDDVDGGSVILMSPVMDLTIYYEPVVSYYTWFVNGGGTGSPPNDSFEVRISNGTEEVVLETITTSNPAWNDRSVLKVSDFIAITNTMRIIFEVSDQTNDEHIVEGAVDGFLVQESAYPPFNYSIVSGCQGLLVEFEDTTHYAYAWNWVFENGFPQESGFQNQVVEYSIPGMHSVLLEVTTNTGASFYLEIPDLVDVMSLPDADFNFTVTGAEASFINTSMDSDSYLWDFNDGTGSTATDENPVYTFTSVDTFEVTLAATNGCGTTLDTQLVVIEAIPPTAAFMADQTKGCEPFEVAFTDESPGVPTSWLWTFPGGTPATSTDQDPVVIYSQSGAYNVQLLVTNAAGESEIMMNDLIVVESLPQAGFNFIVNGPTVQFTNTTTNAVTFEWQFNDGLGNSSSEINPTYTFPGLGDYEVILSSTNDCGTVQYMGTITITAVQPTAQFEAGVVEGCTPLTVQYTDLSSGGEISNWNWQFPGGFPATSTEQNPSVIYTAAGSYGATLVVNNPAGSDLLQLSQLVTVNDVPIADFSFTINGPVVEFSNNSQNADSLLWSFGDPGTNTSTMSNPSFIYGDTGTYQVVLTATNQCGTISVEQDINISAVFPNAAFSFQANESCVPVDVHFMDESIGGEISSWEWIFPGGSPASSIEMDPIVEYTLAGTYDVSLKITNQVGTSEIFEMGLIVTEDVPEAGFEFAVNGLQVDFQNNSEQADSYEWDFGDGSGMIFQDENPIYSFPDTGQYEVTLTAFNACGESQFNQLVGITSPTADLESKVEWHFQATPNPFSDQIKVTYAFEPTFNQAKITMFNVLGETIISQEINESKGEIYLGDQFQANGVYLIQLIVDGRKGHVYKIIKY